MMYFQSSEHRTAPSQADLFATNTDIAPAPDPDGPYRLPPLGFELNALEPVYSAESLNLHYNGVHRAQITRANAIFRRLLELRRERKVTEWIHLQKELAFHLAGHFLHSVFWRNIAPGNGGNSRPSENLVNHIEQAFGDFDAMREQFWAAARCLDGDGWTGLVWDNETGKLAIRLLHENQGPRATDPVPILVMDLWDHAYSRQHNGALDRWIRDFWDLINWADVSRNFDVAKIYRMSVSIDSSIPRN